MAETTKGTGKMKKPKFLYRVRVYKELLCDDEPSNVRYEIGIFDTYAESEDKAINNVRFRVAGLKSQYLPICTSGHHDDWLVYKAEQIF